MEVKSQSLEKKLEKIDWKQWLPVYGFYKVRKANRIRAPALNDDPVNHPIRFFGGLFYHQMTTCGAVYGSLWGTYCLLDKLVGK